jgi:uncharacterized protein YggU (UPF0235/DUF167 family)
MGKEHKVVITIKAYPRSGKSLLQWDMKQELFKCYVKSAPERNQANNEICRLIEKELGRDNCSAVAIVSGATTRKKLVAITTILERDAVFLLLGCVIQQKI